MFQDLVEDRKKKMDQMKEQGEERANKLRQQLQRKREEAYAMEKKRVSFNH